MKKITALLLAFILTFAAAGVVSAAEITEEPVANEYEGQLISNGDDNQGDDQQTDDYTIALNATALTLGVGESFDLNVTYSDPNAVRGTFFTIDKTAVATVNRNNGIVTAKSTGTATVTATAANGATATCKITVLAAPKGITLNATALTLGKGEKYDLNVTYSNPECMHKTTYTSGNSSVASVNSSNGIVTALKAGSATITAKTYNGKTAACKITVKPAPKGITLNASSLTLGVGEKFDINVKYANDDCVKKTYYSVNNSNVLSLNKSNGVITAKGTGSAIVTAKTYNGITATCAVTVKEAPKSISLNATSVSLAVGQTFDIDVTYSNPACLHKTYYTSNNTGVATVNKSNGVVTAKKTGTAVITAKTYNGLTKTCSVTVKKSPTSISMNRSTATFGVGETSSVKAVFNSGETGKVTYSSNNTGVLTVNSSTGAVSAKKTGYATITAKTHNGKTAKCYVTVKSAPSRVEFANTKTNMQVGESVQFYLNSSYSTQGFSGATYTNSSPSVITVTSGGKVTAIKAGTATVTATSYNGKKAKITVTVLNQSGYTKKTTTASTTMRTEAGWKYSSITSVPKGATVYLYATSSDGRWYKVKYGNRYGWLYNKALGVSKNYSSISTSTLPAVADDLIFDLTPSKRSIYDYVYGVAYRNSDNDTTENLCVEAFRYGRGSCYHHAALIEYLYNRCGFQTVRIVGIDNLTGGSDHSWCLCKTASGWRHVDAQAIITGNGLFDNTNQYFVKDSLISQFFSWDRSSCPAAE